ncbi:MAG: protein translocase subunit SecDF [Bacteroidota bacterium]|nr:protein translocase subunit SecDF [Bacteroidota bacterium]MDP4204753.1 protein translocase subunit SecDF [Bacteroidota bacterium]
MQNKGAIWLFTIALTLVSAYYLSFTYFANKVRKDATEYAKGDPAKKQAYLDSISGETVLNLGVKKFTYRDVQDLEMNLGLDLQGGMNVTLEVSVVDIVRAMSNFSKDKTFNVALQRAQEMQKSSQEDFVTLFGRAFEQTDPNAKLAAIFSTFNLKDKVHYNSSNSEVLSVIRKETDAAIDNAFNVLRARIDRFGVVQPNIQPLQTKGQILIELPGIQDAKRVRNLLQGTAQLEFWETYENAEIYPSLMRANQIIKEVQSAGGIKLATQPLDSTAKAGAKPSAKVKGNKVQKAPAKKDSSLTELMAQPKADSTKGGNVSLESARKDYPLFSVLNPNSSRDGQPVGGPVVGYSLAKDTAKVNAFLKLPQVRSSFPNNVRFAWSAKPMSEKSNIFQLIALKVNSRDGRAPLTGDAIVDARQDYGQSKAESEVDMSMNTEGAKIWARMTKENIGRCIAIVLDGYVQSFPVVNQEINGGRSQISGHFTVNEAKDLANILKSGKMPAPARIIQEEIVGPSLGKEAIQSGLISFIVAFLLVLAYMIFFYAGAGIAANVALLLNTFFMFGVLASFQSVLTLPGIAGIVITLGIAVDANVLIYERVEEEIRSGKGLRQSISEGYRHALSAIIDGHVTSLITGIILYVFGTGPIKGFATTFIIGIISSLFTSILITRLIFERRLNKNLNIKFVSDHTKDILRHVNVHFLNMRKYFYIFSGTLMLISIISFGVRGFELGTDFKGGRAFVMRFDQPVKVADIRNALTNVFGSAPEVKTYGDSRGVRVTTNYMVDDLSSQADNKVDDKLYQGLKKFASSGISKQDFLEKYRLQSRKVGPTISNDIKTHAVLAVFYALIAIFLYIAFRFRNWQFGIGGLVSLAHDTIIVLGFYSLMHGIFPFSMEIDQGFIAAILTIIGYSITDTVVVFDRIREYRRLYPKREKMDTYNAAMNSTLRRTMSTSLTVLLVLFVIFLFGGSSIKGFIFALLAGVGFGTYSSVFVATPVAYDALRWFSKKKGGSEK